MRKSGYHTAQIGKWHTGTDSGWGHAIGIIRSSGTVRYILRTPVPITDTDPSASTASKTVEGYPADNYRRSGRFDPTSAAKPRQVETGNLWLCYGSIHGPSKPAGQAPSGMYTKGSPVEVPAGHLSAREQQTGLSRQDAGLGHAVKMAIPSPAKAAKNSARAKGKGATTNGCIR